MSDTNPKANVDSLKRMPTGVTFQRDTLYRLGSHGDNWCITWAQDDSQITSMDDGAWLKTPDIDYHNHLYRILGDSSGFSREDIPDYPAFVHDQGGWFGYGIVSVDGVLYSVVSKTSRLRWSGPFRGIKLLRSDDNGQTWYRADRNGNYKYLASRDPMRHSVNIDEMFFLEEFGVPHKEQIAYPFSFVDFVQCGIDNSAAQDPYLYIYAPEGAHTHHLMLARAPKERLGVRSDWEYFTSYNKNQSQWSTNVQERQPVLVFPRKSQDGNFFGAALGSLERRVKSIHHGYRWDVCWTWYDGF